MKKLYLIRHGKSSWDYPELSDDERPLKKRGHKDGAIMGNILKEKNVIPDLLISSPANRAHSTSKIIADHVGYDRDKILIQDDLYFSGAFAIMDVIRQIDDSRNTVFIFGHNPDFTELANAYSDEIIGNVPTTGVVGIEFSTSHWRSVSTENGNLFYFDYPSKHK